MDHGKGNFVDYTLVYFAEIFIRKLKKEEIKESGADFDGDDCDVEGEISGPEGVSLAAR